MKFASSTFYIFAVVVGVMIANPAIITVIFDGPDSLTEIYNGVLLKDVYSGNVEPRETSQYSKLFWAGVYVAFGVYALFAGTISKAIKFAPLFFIFFVALVFLSTLWSYKPHESILRGLHLFGKSLVAYQLTRYFTLHGVFCYLRDCLLVVVIASFTVIQLYPEIGLKLYGDSFVWSGLFTNKNGLGHCAALSTILCFHFYRENGFKAFHFAAAFGFSLVVTVASQSATACIALAVGLLIYICAGIFGMESISSKLRYRILIYGSIGVLLVLAIGIGFWEPLLVTIDRDITLTGRTVIWSGVWQMIQEELLLGYGYRAAWTTHEVFFHVLSKIQTWVSDAHNAFLQSWLELGVIGFLLFTGYILGTIINWIKIYSGSGSPVNLLAGILLLMLLLIAMLESALFTSQEIHWFMWAMISMSLWTYPNTYRAKLFQVINDHFAEKIRLTDVKLPAKNKSQFKKNHSRRRARRKRSVSGK